MHWQTIGHAGVAQGWRETVADRVSRPAAKRLPLDADAIRAAIGIGFFALSAVYVARTLRRALRA